ncbi:hypothetical protein D3C81_1821640 [compost metagenome]
MLLGAAHTVASLALGPVQRLVGQLQDALHCLAAGRPVGDASRDGEAYAARRFAGLGAQAQALGGQAGALQTGTGQQHDEFLAAGATQHIVAARALAHQVGKVANGLVADFVSVVVVDLLEVVDVEGQNGEGLLAGSPLLQGDLQAAAVE